MPGQNFSPISNLNFTWHSSRPFPLVLSLDTWEKRPTLSSLCPPIQGAVESKEVTPEPPFLQAEPPQTPQPLPIRFMVVFCRSWHSERKNCMETFSLFLSHAVLLSNSNTSLEHVCSNNLYEYKLRWNHHHTSDFKRAQASPPEVVKLACSPIYKHRLSELTPTTATNIALTFTESTITFEIKGTNAVFHYKASVQCRKRKMHYRKNFKSVLSFQWSN